MVKPEDDVILMTNRAQTLRTRVSEIRETGRNAQGVRVMHVASDERVVALEALEEEEDQLADDDDEIAMGDTSGEDATIADLESAEDQVSGEGDLPGETADSDPGQDQPESPDEEPESDS